MLLRALIGAFCCLLAGLLGAPAATALERPRDGIVDRNARVLIINGYDASHALIRTFTEGFLSVLDDERGRLELHFETLDAVRLPGKDAALARYLAEKFAQRPPDYIVAVGNTAYNFVQRRRATLFPGKPLLHGFVSMRRPEDLGELAGTTGIATSTDWAGNFRLIKQLLPRTRHLAVYGHLISDTARANIDDALREVADLYDSVERVPERTLDELLARLGKLPRDAALVPTGWIYSPAGDVIDQQMVDRAVAAVTGLPQFSAYDFLDFHSVVGGHVVSTYDQGRTIGERLLQLRRGTPIEALPRQSEQPRRHVFGYPALRRFGIDESALPPGSTVLHRPPGMREASPTLFYGGIVALAVMLMLTLTLATILRLRQQAAERLAASEARYRLLFEDNPTPVFAYDVDTMRILAVNPAYCELHGVGAERLIDLPLTAVVPEDLRDFVRREVAARARSIRVEHSQMRALRLAGGELEIETWSRPTLIGKHRARIVMLQDVSQRVAAERALQRSEAALKQLNTELESRVAQRSAELELAMARLAHSEKLAALGRLVAGIAHELNTPLGNALTVTSALQPQLDELRAAQAAGTLRRSEFERFLDNLSAGSELAHRNVQRASELVRDFKEIASSQTASQRQRFALKAPVDCAVKRALATARTRVDLTLDVADKLQLDSYPDALEQIIAKLLDNVLTHAVADHRPLSVHIAARSLGDEQLQLTLADDGSGMDAATAEHAFDPFFTTRLGQNTGLGLYLVHNLVTSVLGGRIVLHTAPNQGCRYELLLPLSAPLPEAQAGML